MTTQRNTSKRVRPSDLGVWDYNHAASTARWVWRYNSEHLRVLDTGDVRHGGQPLDIRRRGADSSVLCRIEHDTHHAFLTTRGTLGKGGTRHSIHRDLIKAQDAALKWLDRRFRVEVLVEEVQA